ncbi:MAG TPA: diguanylate cyclase [Acidimicrobiales bacterium]|nr:diguanylate cyclase [Acidimicrobiales bacterium]
MTLRRRLTLLVALTIVVPITAVGVTVVNLIGNEVEQRTYERLRQGAAFAAASLAEDAVEVDRLAGGIARDARLAEGVAVGGGLLDATLRQYLLDLDLDVAVLEDGAGTVVASARRDPVLPSGGRVPSDEELASAGGDGTIGLSRVATEPVVDGAGATITVGRWLDGGRLARVARSEGVALSLVAGDELVATTADVGPLPSRPDLTGEYEESFGGARRLAVGTPARGTGFLILASSPPPSADGPSELILLFGGLLLVLTVLIVLVGYVVSGLVTRPVEELADAARAVSRGDLTQRVEPAGDVELEALGRAFNEMTDNLRTHVEQLEQSRHEFQAAMARLGDVLVSTHDLGGIIDVVLEACTLTLRADEALFFERVAMPARIRATAAQSWAVPSLELNGTGLAGAAARELAPVVFPAGAPGGDAAAVAELADGEPAVGAAMAVPVVSDGRLFGVIAVYGRSGGGPFRPEDVHTLQTLARQTEVAIGNVFLHDETRRQARTDGTTGLWNRREFELRALDSVKEATRFEEQFGVILVDIDDFKRVNDDYDHSTGDAALIWLASRLSEATREIDVVARWGGEEFIVLLPRAGADETSTVAERIRATVAADPVVDGSKVIPLTVSIGMAVHPADGATADVLFKAADAALLRAKRMGKNRVERARTEEGVA